MIKKRLIGLLSRGKKYIIFQVVWQWFALLCQILIIYAAAMALDQALFGTLTGKKLGIYICLGGGGMALRFFCDRQASHASFMASVNVKGRCGSTSTGSFCGWEPPTGRKCLLRR